MIPIFRDALEQNVSHEGAIAYYTYPDKQL